MLGEGLHTDGFGGVMATKNHVDLQLFGVEECLVRSFAGHERVETVGGGLRDRSGAVTGDHPNASNPLAPKRQDSRRGAESRRERATQIVPRAASFSPHPNGRTVIHAEVASYHHTEQPSENDVVADVGMTVEGQVCGVQRDVGLNQSRNAGVCRTNEWSQPTPEQAVMDHHEVDALLGCHAHSRFAQIDGRREPRDLARVGDLQAIECFGRIGELSANAEVIVEILDECV